MLTTHQTLVSIITPCYNSKSTIQETIQSVISQTYPHWEMLSLMTVLLMAQMSSFSNIVNRMHG